MGIDDNGTSLHNSIFADDKIILKAGDGYDTDSIKRKLIKIYKVGFKACQRKQNIC